LDTGQLQTLTFIMFVFAGQALVYVLREHGPLWTSRPSLLMMFFSVADVTIVSLIATSGLLTPSLPVVVVLSLLAATCVFALLLDQVKVVVFRHLPID
jgi:H+-transporting ATPase